MIAVCTNNRMQPFFNIATGHKIQYYCDNFLSFYQINDFSLIPVQDRKIALMEFFDKTPLEN